MGEGGEPYCFPAVQECGTVYLLLISISHVALLQMGGRSARVTAGAGRASALSSCGGPDRSID